MISQSAPKLIAQVVFMGSQILGRAFIQAWRQAARSMYLFICTLHFLSLSLPPTPSSSSPTPSIEKKVKTNNIFCLFFLILIFLIFIDAQASAPTGVEQGSRGSADVLSRTYNMTLDEAALILNLKKGTYTEPSELQQMLKVFPLPSLLASPSTQY